MHKHFKRKRHCEILDRLDINLVIINIVIITCYSLDTGRKLIVYKTFRRCSERVMKVQFTSCVQGVFSNQVWMATCTNSHLQKTITVKIQIGQSVVTKYETGS